MAEYIEREALEIDLNGRLYFLAELNGEYDQYTMGFFEAVTRVKNFPSADVAPVRHGRWECNKPCPVCGGDRFDGLDADIWADWEPPYCPNCGAKMDEVSE